MRDRRQIGNEARVRRRDSVRHIYTYTQALTDTNIKADKYFEKGKEIVNNQRQLLQRHFFQFDFSPRRARGKKEFNVLLGGMAVFPFTILFITPWGHLSEMFNSNFFMVKFP